MSKTIADPELERIAHELAQLSGTSVPDAIRTALETHLELTKATKLMGKINAIIAHGRAAQVLDSRPESEILGYDEDGIPT